MADSNNQFTVLYVEDNPANMQIVRKILQRRPNIELLTAPQAYKGIELARAHCPDLILMDINMPGMDGITALGHLLEYEETKNIPVVALSANAMEMDIKKAMDAGFESYITKPFPVLEFLESIDRLLGEKNPT